MPYGLTTRTIGDRHRDAGKGTERIGLADTPDADYGQILETALLRKGSWAQQDSNLRPPGS